MLHHEKSRFAPALRAGRPPPIHGRPDSVEELERKIGYVRAARQSGPLDTGWMMRLSRQQERWIWHGGLGALALAVLVVPHLITAAPLDMLAEDHHGPGPAEQAGANFPGSAFF